MDYEKNLADNSTNIRIVSGLGTTLINESINLFTLKSL